MEQHAEYEVVAQCPNCQRKFEIAPLITERNRLIYCDSNHFGGGCNKWMAAQWMLPIMVHAAVSKIEFQLPDIKPEEGTKWYQ